MPMDMTVNKIYAWFHPRELWYFLLFVYRSFMENDGITNAKAMTYTTLFAVVPLFALTAFFLSAFPQLQDVATQVEDMIFSRLLPSSSLQVRGYIQEFSSQAKNLTWVGGIMLVVTAYMMLVNIERNFNAIWGIGEQRKGLSSFLIYWGVLSLSPLLLGFGYAVNLYITSLSLFQSVSEFTNNVGGTSISLVVFPIILTTLAFTLLYLAVPNCGIRIKHAMIGGLVVAVSFAITRRGYMWVMSKMSFEFIYGTFAALPVFLIWIFVCWVVIFFGANLVRCLPLYRREKRFSWVHPSVMIMALLHKFWVAHQTGNGVEVQNLINQEWPFKDPNIDEYLNFLVAQKIIRAVDEDEYLLVRDLNGIPMWEFFEKVPWARVTLADLERPLPEVLKNDLPCFEQWKEKVARVEGHFRDTYRESIDDIFRKHQPV